MGTLFLVLALWAYLKARQAQIEGRPGRTGLLLALLLWVAAMGCKEDSVLLPAYTLALELTVLRFSANSTRLAGILRRGRSEEHTSELQSLMRISYAVFCLKKKKQ